MKLGSLRGGRDGRLVVVSNDLAWCVDARPIASTLQEALDNWERCEADLRGLAESLEHGAVPRQRFHEHEAASPLPRAYRWALGGEPLTHGAGDGFAGPRDPVAAGSGHALAAVIVGDAAPGAGPEAVRLVMLGCKLADGSAAFSPAAVTPDALAGWKEGTLTGTVELELNGATVSESPLGVDFAALACQASTGRRLSAGVILASSVDGTSTPLADGDVVRIEVRDARRHSIFGAIEHAVTRV